MNKYFLVKYFLLFCIKKLLFERPTKICTY